MLFLPESHYGAETLIYESKAEALGTVPKLVGVLNTAKEDEIKLEFDSSTQDGHFQLILELTKSKFHM